MCSTPYIFYLTPFWGVTVCLSPGPSVSDLGKLYTYGLYKVYTLTCQNQPEFLKLIGSIFQVIVLHLEFNYTKLVVHRLVFQFTWNKVH